MSGSNGCVRGRQRRLAGGCYAANRLLSWTWEHSYYVPSSTREHCLLVRSLPFTKTLQTTTEAQLPHGRPHSLMHKSRQAVPKWFKIPAPPWTRTTRPPSPPQNTLTHLCFPPICPPPEKTPPPDTTLTSTPTQPPTPNLTSTLTSTLNHPSDQQGYTGGGGFHDPELYCSVYPMTLEPIPRREVWERNIQYLIWFILAAL